ncbi:STAS domain-containing protein [Romeria aff. gracilis LEGE 07310]|uniref:STAS domain-containing protein n=1 Tax=Vasconcelosia minhoensis LEGE 07310 TaxID=915328 RepID=A0A8J7ABJ6_9CYAN|nr:STAS domain-containing protein [Romeria gracilis]MBE9076619.1 STAS domain-containing protein [Romeria aff. gracilis LEGE 07310]
MQILNSSITVIRPAGALDAKSASQFQQQLISAISAEHALELRVDMSQVESLDNAGLVCLMSALNTAQMLRKRLSICSVPPSIQIVFELTQLDRIFTLLESAASPQVAAA